MYLQGLCVATLFCFFNGEVVAQIKRKWRTIFYSNRPRSNSYTATQVSVSKTLRDFLSDTKLNVLLFIQNGITKHSVIIILFNLIAFGIRLSGVDMDFGQNSSAKRSCNIDNEFKTKNEHIIKMFSEIFKLNSSTP